MNVFGDIKVMFDFFKKKSFPIGIDMGDGVLKLAQLNKGIKGTRLVCGRSRPYPSLMRNGSLDWQKWAIETIHELISDGNFQGREVIAALPSSEVFIDLVKAPKLKDAESIEEAVFAKVKQKVPFESANVMTKCIPTEEENILFVATDREKINRYLAIYENAHLQIKSICIWPMALARSYATFFGRRASDANSVVMLLDIESNCTNIVICRHKNVLFARSVQIGLRDLKSSELIDRLAIELINCKRAFSLLYRNSNIDRLIFLSGFQYSGIEKETWTKLAKKLEMPAQIGDCLAAVEVHVKDGAGCIERRGCEFSWAAAFGLSLLQGN